MITTSSDWYDHAFLVIVWLGLIVVYDITRNYDTFYIFTIKPDFLPCNFSMEIGTSFITPHHNKSIPICYGKN